MTNIRIGYFQYLPEFFNVRYNLDNVKSLLIKNRREIFKLDLVVFPEYFLSGPLKLDILADYEKIISSKKTENFLKLISKDYPKTTFVMGSSIFKRKQRYFNTCLVVKNGKILSEYHKKALIYNESYFCDSDNKDAIFKIGKVKIGIAICWDLILPEVFRKYVKKIDLMIVPSFWGVGGNFLQSRYPFSLEKKYYTSLGIARAYENAYALLFVNSVGKYKSPFYSDRMMGGSYFVVPPLGLICKNNNKNPDKLHVVGFDLKPLQEYREFYAPDKDYFYYLNKKVI